MENRVKEIKSSQVFTNVFTESCELLLVGFDDREHLGLRSIAAFLAEHGKKVLIHPFDPSFQVNILENIQKFKPKIVGFSLNYQKNLFDFAGLIAYLRENGVTAHFTMGGHFPTIESRLTLEIIPGLDSVVRGEGELTLLELFEELAQSGPLEKISGLAFRNESGIVQTPPRPLIQNLDSLPFPIRKVQPDTHRGLGVSSIYASRGCCYDCSFCSIHRFYRESPGPKRRTRSPLNVVSEMERLFHEQGTRIFVFEDDDFLMRGKLHQEWLEKMIRELRKRNLADQILWRIACRIDDLNPELLRKMMSAGLMNVYIGIESGNEQGLKIYNKHYTVADIYQSCQILRDLKMPTEFGFMLFHPECTFLTIREDLGFLQELGKDGRSVINFTKMIPYAGTKIAFKLRNEGRLQGTIAAPDYSYQDPRLELLRRFFDRTFQTRNYSYNGLVQRLRLAKFDAIVLRKFFAAQYDSGRYAEEIQKLIIRSNNEALKILGVAAYFMEGKDSHEIIDQWSYLELLAQEERKVESEITETLDRLMNKYDFKSNP